MKSIIKTWRLMIFYPLLKLKRHLKCFFFCLNVLYLKFKIFSYILSFSFHLNNLLVAHLVRVVLTTFCVKMAKPKKMQTIHMRIYSLPQNMKPHSTHIIYTHTYIHIHMGSVTTQKNFELKYQINPWYGKLDPFSKIKRQKRAQIKSQKRTLVDYQKDDDHPLCVLNPYLMSVSLKFNWNRFKNKPSKWQNLKKLIYY